MKLSSPFTVLIAVFIVASLEKPGDIGQGLTPLGASWVTWEEHVFDRFLKKLQKHEFLYEKNLKNRITQQVSRYKTGLKKNHLHNLPGWIVHEGKKYGYDPLLLTAVIITESSFNNWARSSKGALGLMQIRPATGKELANEVSVQWRGTPSLYDGRTMQSAF